MKISGQHMSNYIIYFFNIIIFLYYVDKYNQ